MLRSERRLDENLSDTMQNHMRAALDWIITNAEQYNGLIGFIGADIQPGRVYSGLHNQGWKDTEAVYQTSEGENAPHPIKDVLVNAEAWAALHDGANYFASKDAEFSDRLQRAATNLRQRFNTTNDGFVLATNDGLAQAIDGNDRQLEQSSVDQGAVLWAQTADGKLCVDPNMTQSIIEKMLSPDMFNPEAGIRDYAKGTVFTHGTNYHGSPNTYWPFMSGMVARGLEQLGRSQEAEKIMYAFLNAIYELGTNIEMFIQDDQDRFEPWSHPDPEIGQKSSRQQAWTAAAVYYATSYLLHKEGVVYES
jgi:glycogen debranching enzyme